MKAPMSRLMGLILGILTILCSTLTIVITRSCDSAKQDNLNIVNTLNTTIKRPEFEAFKEKNDKAIDKKADKELVETKFDAIIKQYEKTNQGLDNLTRIHLHSQKLNRDTIKLSPLNKIEVKNLCYKDGKTIIQLNTN